MSINTTYLDLCTQVYEISKPTAPEDALAFYKSMAVFLFLKWKQNMQYQLGVWRDSKWLRPDGKMILLSSFADIDSNICSFVAKYELVNKNKVLQTEIEEYKIKIYDPGLLVRIAKEYWVSRC